MTTAADHPTSPSQPGRGDPHDVRTYYGMPVLKEPEWTWEVPWYLFAGGLAGASSALAALARLTGHAGMARRATVVAGGAAVVSPVLLVKDLGRPARFLNMLRVFKPTSAMSMGSWLLAVYGPVASGAALLESTDRLPRLRAVLGAKAALLGLPMATYTAVLLSDTSIPVWHEARDELPFVFAGSASASAGAAAMVLAPAGAAGPAKRAVVAGVALGTAAQRVMEHRLGDLAEPYDEGDAGRYGKAAQWLDAVGCALVLGSGRSGVRAVSGKVGAAMVLGGAICQRWSVFRAGFQSARDPKYVVGPQRGGAPTY